MKCQNMHNCTLKSIVIIFFIKSFIYAQEMPSFLFNKYDEESLEEISDVIYSIRESNIDIKTLKYSELKSLFYFIEDSILKVYKSYSGKLDSEYQNFFDQFEKNLDFHSYSIMRKSLNETIQNDRFLGNNLILKQYLTINHKKLHFSLRSIKLKNEHYFSHQFFFVKYQINDLKIIAGNQKINGSNPLVLSSPYGKTYYQFQKINIYDINRYSSQNSIDKQNQFRGLTLNYNPNNSVKINSSYGLQDYNVTFYNEHFRSFNFYFPQIKQKTIDRKKTIKETFFFNEIAVSLSENHQLNLQALWFKLSKPVVLENDFNEIKRQDNIHFGLQYKGRFASHNIQVIAAFDQGNTATEVHYQRLNKKNKFTFSYFYYPQRFYNHHATGLYDGRGKANNEYGFLIQNWYRLKHFDAEFSYLKRREIDDRFVSAEKHDKEFFQTAISSHLKNYNFSVVFKQSTNKKLELKLIGEFAKSNLLIKQRFFLDIASTYSLLKYSFNNSRIGFAYAKTINGFASYRYGIYREFLTKYFSENTFHFFLGKKHEISDKFSFNFIYDFFKTTEKSNHDIAISINLKF